MARKKLINLHGTTKLSSIKIKEGESDLQYGEIAVNYSNDDPNLYIRKQDDTIASVSDMVKIPEYTLVSGSPASGMSAEYHLEKDGQQVGPSINIPKDQFLKSATYNNETKQLVFVFETSTGETTTTIDVTDFASIYTEGNGISISDNTISLKAVADNGLSLDSEGLKLNLASEGSAGTLKSVTIGENFSATSEENLIKTNLSDGVLTIQVSDTIDCGTYE